MGEDEAMEAEEEEEEEVGEDGAVNAMTDSMRLHNQHPLVSLCHTLSCGCLHPKDSMLSLLHHLLHGDERSGCWDCPLLR